MLFFIFFHADLGQYVYFWGTVFLCSFWDTLSLIVTYYLLKLAVKAKSLGATLLHLFLDMLLVLLTVFLVFSIAFASKIFLEFDGEDLTGFGQAQESGVLAYIYRANGLLYFAVILAVSSGFPSFVYLTVLIVSTILWLTPQWVHRQLNRIIFLLTTDKTPVLKLLGTALGAIGTGVALLLKLMAGE